MARRYKRFKDGSAPAASGQRRNGQGTVKYIKREDYAEMSRLALVNRDKYKPGSAKFYMWYRDYILMLVGVNCGSRIETILEWMPSDFSGRAATITENKTGKRMQFDLNADVYAELKKFIDFCEITDHEFIFRKTRGSKDAMTAKTAWLRIKTLAKMAGIKYNVGAHSLRKSYGRWEYERTRDIHRVAKLLQHSDPKVTETYIGLTDGEIDLYRESICNLPIRTGSG